MTKKAIAGMEELKAVTREGSALNGQCPVEFRPNGKARATRASGEQVKITCEA